MDSEDIINGFINRYRILQKDENPNHHAYQQLDETICRMEARHFAESQPNVVIESLTYLFELVDDSTVNQILVQRSLILLHNIFSKRCYGFVIKPKYILHFTESLASNVSVNHEDYDENELEKRLQILQYLTYGITMPIVDDYLKKFIDFLMAKVKTGSSRQLLKSSLMILQNLINKSSVVKTYIRNGTDPREFYVALLRLMDQCTDSLVRILAMNIYTTLDSKGRKVVSSTDVSHIFELIFGIVIQNDEDAISYAVDLLVDLLTREAFLKQFLKFKYLKVYIQKVVGHLPKLADQGSVSKVYELLLTLCSIDNLRPTVLAIIFDSQNFHSDQPCPLTLATNWFHKELKYSQTSTSYSAVFLTNLLKEANNYISLGDYSFDEHIDPLAEEIGKQLGKCNQRSYTITSESCQRVIIILEVMTSLCEHLAYLDKISKGFNLNLVLSSVFEVHLRTCEADNLNSHITEDYMSNVVDVIIRLLMFMYNVKDRVDNLQEVFYLYLQDCRLMQIFAKALSMDSKSRIQNTMLLVNIGMKLPNFPQIRLCEAMSKLNSIKHTNSDASSDAVPPKSSVESRLSIPPVSHDIAESVDQLIAHFKKDLQLKNLKPSQLMDVYEHKVQMLEMKCNNFEQLLDAKSKNLQQAENIIAQYRFRWAQDEGLENLHLRSIIHEVEKRNETLIEETAAVKIDLVSIQSKFKESLYDMERLTTERDKLKKANASMSSKCAKLDEQVINMGAEIAVLESRNSTLESKEAASKVQIEELTKSINVLGDEKLAMKKELKDNVVKTNNLKEMYYKLETQYQQLEADNHRLSSDNEVQTAEIRSLKNELKMSNEDVKITKDKLEKKISEYNSLQELLTNVGKMIHGKEK